MTLAYIVMVLGFLTLGVAWVFFRKPGMRVNTFAPVWRANQYLKRAGVLLYGFSMLAFVMAAMLMWLAANNKL